MTGRPAAFSALAFASTARVADSEMADTRADILVVGMYPWWHLRAADHQLVTSTCPDDIQRTAAAATSRPEGASRGTGGRPSGRRTGAATPISWVRDRGRSTAFAIGCAAPIHSGDCN